MTNDEQIRLLKLLQKLPICYCYKLSFSSADSEGGYGWHRIAFVEIYKVGEKCRKCGISTIDSQPKDWDCSPCNRHSWTHDEKRVFAETIEFGDFGHLVDFLSKELGEDVL